MNNESLIKMMKSDFNKMTRKELKKYILSHPTDDEAIRELFITKRSTNAKIYLYPYEMPYEEVEKIFRDIALRAREEGRGKSEK
jgi:hypothetical protein